MSKIERIIKEIENADEIDIMEFDFDECFTMLREMEYRLISLINLEDSGLIEPQRIKVQIQKARELLDYK